VGEDATVVRSALRVLGRGDVEEALALCEENLVANLFVASRLYGVWTDPRHTGGEVWGWYDRTGLRAICWSGANLVPAQAGPEAVEAFAHRARRQGRQCSSIVGPAESVLEMWHLLRPYWGPAREVRSHQPLMELTGPPRIPADPAVRRSEPAELSLVVPACVAMFTEEVGYSPVSADGGSLYQSQVAALVATGRSFVRVEPGPQGPEVVFKAELGSVTPGAVQLQGVWVNPTHRGLGLAAPGVAAVARIVQAEVAPVVSLYVNSFNTRAIRAYERVGFATVGAYATVLF
jgi:uncharacterized protein